MHNTAIQGSPRTTSTTQMRPERAMQRAKPLYPRLVQPAPSAPPAVSSEIGGSASPVSSSGVIARLVAEIGQEQFDRFVKDQVRFQTRPGVLEVIVTADFVRELIGRRFAQALDRVAKAELGPQARVICVVDRSTETPRQSPTVASNGQATIPGTTSGLGVAAKLRRPVASVSGLASLSDFIVGPSNQLAFLSASRLADPTIPTSRGLVFLHGPCGLGKTHLLQGMARKFAEARPGSRVKYLTAEGFTNDYINAVRSGELPKFRESLRQLDLLCVDDVHFLGVGNKAATQLELLHTFNTLSDLGGARLALASDEHPRQIRKLNEALTSRFVSGVVAGLEAPDGVTRAHVAKRWADQHALPLTPEAIEVFVARQQGSIRDLVGELTRLDALYRLAPGGPTPGEPITPASLVRLLTLGGTNASPTSSRGGRPMRVAQIVTEVCRTLGVSESDFKGTGRHKLVVLARALTVHLARKNTSASFPEIARAMNRPNHSSIITALQRLQKQIEGDVPVEAREYLSHTLGSMNTRALVEQVAQDVQRAHSSEMVS
jgi:chromosomal replication initiator protein